MKKFIKILLVIISIVLIVPSSSYALNSDYEDLVYKIVGAKVEENKVNLYLFHREGCPHCAKEIEFLKTIKSKYSNLNIYMYEVSKNTTNSMYLQNVKKLFNDTSNGVPYTVIGKESLLGYSDFVSDKIEKTIQNYLESDKTITSEKQKTEVEKYTFKLPLIGKVNVKDTSVSIIAVILGLVDGFNPCAMWILLFLINMFFGMKNKKRMFILGYIFLFTSAFVYFISMLGISVVLSIAMVNVIQRIIALVALVAGILNIRTYIKSRKDDGCHIVNDKKRKKILSKIQKIVKEESLILSIVGIVTLAISVNLVELACSLGFPAIFSEILSLNNINGISRIIYLILYVFFYMLDDLIVFTIAVCTLSISAKSTKYTKYVNLIAGIIMIIIGILLIFKPEWVMFDF